MVRNGQSEARYGEDESPKLRKALAGASRGKVKLSLSSERAFFFFLQSVNERLRDQFKEKPPFLFMFFG
jgi:hypothetical protein